MRNFLLAASLLLTVVLALPKQATATHLMGGEITWECNGNGEYVFTFKVYRDCSGNPISPNTSGLIQIHNYPTLNNVIQIPPTQWTTVRDADISPDCSGPGSFSCANGDDESVFEYVRTFTRKLNGTPPPAGWIITYDDVARNSNDNIQGQPGLTLRAKILPHSGTVADTCVDNSPQFQEIATSLICVGIPFNYNHNATDVELDSLVFEWARPLNAIGTNQLYQEGSVPSNVAFQSGYSFNSPFPGPAQDVRNVAASLDRNTGEISLTSFTSGKYVSVVKVTAYKCGEAVAEIYRELQSNLANSSVCNTNDKPVVRPPFQDPSNNFTLWNDTVRAGDLVNFNIQIQDFASIAQNGGDSVTLSATGLQFGTNFTSTTGCFNPPCATLTSTLPQTGFLGVSNSFSWQTDCNHVAFTDQCVSGQNTYTFVITAEDNRCPLPLKNVGTISITVLADSVILSPLIHCTDVQPNGDVKLDWNLTPNIQNSFSAWMIYSATAENGPYSLIDSVKTYSTSTYTHTGANAQTQRRWYYIRSRSGCKGIVQNVARDTVSTIFVDPVTTATQVDVNWNPLSVPNPQGSAAQYEVFREYTIGSGLSFFQNVSGETFTDNFPNCQDSVRYRIDLVNPLEGCTSRSNTLLYQVQFPDPIADFTYPATACPGDPVNFTNTTSISGGTITYVWDFGDGSPTSTQVSPTHTYSTSGTFSIELIANTPKGCSDTISKTIQITLPTADAGTNTSVCPGNSTAIGGSPTSTSPSASYTWSPAATLNNASIANPTASPIVNTTYTVTVTDVNGCTNTDQVTVAVSSLPSADAGPDRNTCSAVPVMIGGSPTGPATATYNWDNGASLDDPTASNPMASPTVTTTYTVTVSTGVNCSATDQVTVTVDPSPTANAGADQAVCSGFGVSIGSVASGGTPNYTYSWSPSAGLSASNIASPTATPAVTTSYTVTVTDANGCTDDDMVTVTVNSANADAGGTFVICDGSAITIGGTSSGTLPLTFAWDNGATLSATNVQLPLANPTVTTTYTLTVTDNNGCTDIDQATVTVNPLPTADAGADQNACPGATVNIGGAPTGPAGATYSWSPSANLSSSTAANPTATAIGTVVYTVTVTDGNGCTNTDQVTVTAFPSINPDAGADQTICDGGLVLVGGTTTGGSMPYTYAWNNGASLNNATIANPSASPTVTTTYTLTVTDNNGCSATDAVVVNVNSLPLVDAGLDQTICAGTAASLGGSPTGPAGSTYAWDNTASLNDASLANPIATPSTSTTYTVTVSDGNGCTDTDQIIITVDPLPNVDAGADQTICQSESIVIGGSPTSSTPGASFSWSNSASLDNGSIANPTASPIVTTTYTVTVTHTNGCTDTDQMTVTVNASPLTEAGPDQDICIGQSTPIGGSPTGLVGSSYAWSPAASLDNASLANPSATPTVTTIYTVTVTDGNGCSDTDQMTVNVNPLPVVDAGTDQSICAGESATLGGIPTGPAGSTYIWDNTASLDDATAANPLATPSATTTYTVTVTDGNGCSNTDQVIITVEPLPNVDAGPDQVICDLQTVVIGGAPTSSTPSATFAWDNGATLDNTSIANPTASPSTTTTYTVTVTHPNGCTATDQMTVSVNSLPTADAGLNQDICIGQSTTIGGTPTGPAGSTYNWDNAASLNDNTLANPTATPSATTTYSVTVSDANGCTNTDQVIITVNPLPNVDAGPDQTICDQDAVVIGGSPTSTSPGVTYAWDNTASLDNGGLANPTASPSITTTYTVTVTDPNACTNTDQITVTVNPLPGADAGPDQTICDLQSVTIGGSPTSSAAGVSYAWDNGASLDDATIANPLATPTATTTYTVTVTDGNGCSSVDAVTVTVNPLPTADAGLDQVICLGDNATLGGSPTGPATASYQWDNAASLDDATAANPIATPSATTTYTVTVTDGNACTDIDQVLITVNPVPTADAGPDQVICDLQTVVIGGAPTSSTPSASFAWDNGASLNNASIANPTASPTTTTTYTVTVTHPNGCTAADQMTVTVNPLPNVDAGLDQDICIGQSTTIGGSPTGPAGSTYNWDNAASLDDNTLANPTATPGATTTYSVTVSDANGCTNTDQVTITVNPLPNANAGPDETICDQETVVIGGSPTSTSPGATFAWDNTASLNSGNLSNPTASPNTTTTYTVTVTDPNGCTASDQMTVTVNPLPGADAGPDQSICNLQSVTIGGSPTSSAAGVSYAWDNGASLNDATIANPLATPTATTTYTVTVTDGNGCSSVDAVTVTVNPLPTADAGTDQIICLGDNATLGGSPTGPATASYQWDNAASLNNATTANPIATPSATTTYSVTVTDGNGCTDSDQVLITVNPVPDADAGADFDICNLSSITIGGSPTSTTTGATFAWDNAATLISATVANPTASPAVTTTYTVTVTHPNGCTATDQMTLTVNPLPNADAGADQDICLNQSATLGGTPTGPAGSSFQWDNTVTLNNGTAANPIASPSITTTYNVTVTDVNGCTSTDDIVITVNPLPDVNAGLNQQICLGQSATIGGSPSSITPGVSYSWNNGTTLSSATVANPIATPSVTTTYILTVTDANGCTNIDSTTIIVNPLPNVDAGPDVTICAGPTTSLGGSPTSTTPGVTYLWNNASTLNSPTLPNPLVTTLTTTVYTVTVTDPNGCTNTDQMTLTVNPLPIVDAGADQNICVGDNAILGGSPTGPVGSSYNWDNAATLNDITVANPIATPTASTTYTVTVTDDNGCTDTDDITIVVNSAPIVEAGPDQTICATDSVMIGGSPTGPAGSTYSWTPTAGLSDPTIANPMASPSDTTKYFVAIIDANTCSAIDSMVVNVNELPTVDYRVDAVCFGDFTAFTDLTTLNNSAVQSWDWDFGDNNGTSNLQNPAYQYAAPGDYQVKLIVTTDLGCIDSIEKTVSVNPLPLIDAGADVTICEGDTVELGGTPTGPAGVTYSWSPATGLSDAAEANPMAFPLSTTSYSLSITDANGCFNYDTVEVSVNPLPVVVSNNDTSICKGDGIQLNASGALSYSWQPTTGLSDPLIANPIASPEVSTNYVVFGADANGCIDTDTTFIRVFTVDFMPSDTSVCYGDSIQLSPILDADASSSIQYIWSPSLGLSNPNSANPKASPPVTTDYQVLVQDQRGCVDVDSIRLRIDPRANVDFEYDISPRCEGAVIELTNTSTSTDEFLWQLNGVNRSSDFDPSFDMDYSVENVVTLIGANATCTDSIIKTIPKTNFEDIFEFKDANAFTPNGDGINDIYDPGFKGEFVGCVDFRIYNRWGDKVFDSNNGQYGWDGRTQYGDVAPNGLYFYVINVADQEIRGSVYLQR